MTPARRVLIAIKLLDAVRDAIAKNGNQYDGGAAPNLQSVSDTLTLPSGYLDAHMRGIDARFRPTESEEAELLELWRGKVNGGAG